ncbi:energy transducer TonB [Aliikangiella maris]|uniref:Protein TonB n=2 Tax=Aliikangiella maris TaxID=3162458 RepID=A0ABV3MV41_9GAMM
MKNTLALIFSLTLLASCASKQEQSYREPPDVSIMNDGGAEPLTITNPRYPRDAAMNNVEGWVFLEFDLDENGHPINLTVLDSSPGDIFVEGASNAILKWTFRKNNTQNKSQYLMEFRLAD